MWKAASCALPQSLVIDLGKEQGVKRIFTQFEYPTFYYQYKLEVSSDSKEWTLFSDRTANNASGSPMVDDGNATARFVRITVRNNFV